MGWLGRLGLELALGAIGGTGSMAWLRARCGRTNVPGAGSSIRFSLIGGFRGSWTKPWASLMTRLIPLVVALLGLQAAAARAADEYRVQPGDTLTAIAADHHTTVALLERLNHIPADEVIVIGSRLELPATASPTVYVVRAGDSLTAIAARYGTTVAALARLNGLQPDHFLLIRTSLHVPQASTAADGSSVRASMLRWAAHYDVDPRLAEAVGWMESGFNNNMVSNVGAQGIMQITPDTWQYVEEVLLLGTRVPHDADGNIRVGIALLHHLLHVYRSNERRTLAAYYQGSRSLDTVGLQAGTRLYINDVLALKQRF